VQRRVDLDCEMLVAIAELVRRVFLQVVDELDVRVPTRPTNAMSALPG